LTNRRVGQTERTGDGCIQKIYSFIAPKIIGGKLANSPVGDLGFTTMTEAISLQKVTIKSIGDDLLITGYIDHH
jgi:diaminohydroxyphosphoribosylaminopyrimidine deaminase / 5-amino-6-(5-phosphoribosylamino)uracil reductase